MADDFEAAPESAEAVTDQGGTTTPEAPKEEQMVPLSALMAAREELAATKNTLMLRQAQESQRKPAEPDPVDEIGDDEYLTGKQVKALVRRLSTQVEVGQARNAYSDIIRAELPEILAANPALDQALMRIPEESRLSVVGEMCKAHKANKSKGATPADDSKKMEKILANADKPKSPAAIGAGGKGSMAAIDRYATMSDSDFKAHMERIKRGG